MENAAINNVFGTFGAVCWSIQLIPQIILNWRRHNAAGLSPAFMLFWASAGMPLGVYNIVSDFNIALRIQPQILTSLSLATWGQCHYYQRKWSFVKVTAFVIPAAVVMGSAETALIFAVRIALGKGMLWPLTLMAVLATLLLALGVMEQYIAIWKNRSVEGISFLFCGLDALGDMTSIISVTFEPRLNVLGLVIYTVELVLWLGIFACGCWFKLIPLAKQKIIARKMEAGPGTREGHIPQQQSIMLHNLPSSTSVFRTATARSEARSRV